MSYFLTAKEQSTLSSSYKTMKKLSAVYDNTGSHKIISSHDLGMVVKNIDQILFDLGEYNHMYISFNTLFNNYLEGVSTMLDRIYATKKVVKEK
jgi:hypothetical protein